ncbi:hypothetical protein BU26DRAFT_239161, partial [Trematosphaeria pertusa]
CRRQNQNNSPAFAHTTAHGITDHTSLVLLHQFIVHAPKAHAIRKPIPRPYIVLEASSTPDPRLTPVSARSLRRLLPSPSGAEFVSIRSHSREPADHPSIPRPYQWRHATHEHAQVHAQHPRFCRNVTARQDQSRNFDAEREVNEGSAAAAYPDKPGESMPAGQETEGGMNERRCLYLDRFSPGGA